ncbi:MAG: maiA [Sphingomonadales bacterium]|nr:maiA [Sphingomonadales bacterium]
MTVRLYDYFRSSACYRVRIALNLKGIAYETVPTNIVKGEQNASAFTDKNPQALVPMLEIDGLELTQSLAIIDYLDATHHEPPLMPRDAAARSKVLAMALAVACDIHPLNNLRVLRQLDDGLGVPQAKRDDWYRHWVEEGFKALEKMAAGSGAFLSGATPGVADICLVPQMYNARRLDVDLTPYPTLVRIDAGACTLPSFKMAHPDAVATK